MSFCKKTLEIRGDFTREVCSLKVDKVYLTRTDGSSLRVLQEGVLLMLSKQESHTEGLDSLYVDY